MRTYFDCIPCFVRQALDSARLVSLDETVHEKVLRQVLVEIAEMDFRDPPPAMGQRIHRTIRKVMNDPDPYRKIKERFTRVALDLYPGLKKRVQQSADPMVTAIRLAIAGNIIDFGPRSDLGEEDVEPTIEQALTAPIEGDPEPFRRAVRNAKRILMLADNAGEIVFDRLLIEELDPRKVTVAVKGSPAINDATLEDARAAGVDQIVEVIDNGSDAPATILDDTSESFRERFQQADLVIAKGQGNFETLNEVRKNIFFLLKAKCPVIARDLGCEVGSLVLARPRT